MCQSHGVRFGQLRRERRGGRFRTLREDDIVALRDNPFDHLRLSRDAEMAGQAFGFEDVEALPAQMAQASHWLTWAAGIVLVAGGLTFAMM
jgi:hypothetical protein